MKNPSYAFIGILVVTLAHMLWSPSTVQAQSSSSAWNTPATEVRINDLLRQMTLEEKIGQLVQFSADSITGPGSVRNDYPEMVAKGEIGSLINVTGAHNVNSIQKIAVEKSRLHIPLVFGLDVIHGYRTVFPVPLGLSAAWNPALVEKVSRIAAVEATSDGVRWTFSPMVDIARDARWGRIVEGAGEDPYLGSVLARAYVRGYQGKNLADPSSMAACVKHYVGYGAAEGGRDYNTVDMSERVLRQVYLPPFKAAVDEGSATLMSAFNSLQEVPASANYFTLTKILRQEWGFTGFVVSDWGSVGELIPHGIANDGATAARKALLAGVDMDMQSNLYATVLAQEVRAGRVPEAVVDEAVRRILRIKFALGLFEHPYVNETKPSGILATDHLAVAREAAEASFVLLKDESASGTTPLLPLSPTLRTVALIGPLADDSLSMIGSWAGMGDPKNAVTLRSALAARLNSTGGILLYTKGTEIETSSEDGFAEAKAAAQQSEVVVMALGEDANRMTGEASSRAYLDLPGNQQKLLQEIVSTGKPVVLILFNGRPLVLNWAAAHVPAILEAWFPGVQAGPALVRTLFGEANPSGHLTTSFPRAVGQEPLYYNALNTGRPAKGDLSRPTHNPGDKYYSRYTDEGNSPLFPFGYGLSYTKFQYSDVSVDQPTISAKAINLSSAQLRVTAEVKNIGDRVGSEVAQIYIRQEGTSVARPVRELKGFQKITLTPGESKKVEFTLGREELAFWNLEMKNVAEPARLTVWVAPNSAMGSSTVVKIEP